MRRLVKEHPEIRVIHRAFALAPTPEALINMFGSKERAKKRYSTIGEQRISTMTNIEIGLTLWKTSHLIIHTRCQGLVACKAAERQGGQQAHWDMFDRIQRAHLTEAQNIADYNVLKQCAIDVGLDVERWEEDYKSKTIHRRSKKRPITC